jgi:hypothetical protein
MLTKVSVLVSGSRHISTMDNPFRELRAKVMMENAMDDALD